MATRTTILPWGIPGTEEPGRLQSVGRLKRLSTQTMTFVSDNSPSALKVAEGLWLCPSH